MYGDKDQDGSILIDKDLEPVLLTSNLLACLVRNGRLNIMVYSPASPPEQEIISCSGKYAPALLAVRG